MQKRLSERSLEELWELFPITLTPPQAHWPLWYKEEACRLRALLPEPPLRISHIGSTAISGIWAKPIVDILLELSPGVSPTSVKSLLERGGYTCMSQSTDRISLNLGYTESGFAQRVFHLHVRRGGDHDELYFRDYLNDHPALALEYQQLKLQLWKQYPNNRDAYTQAKSAFVTACTQKANAAYAGRYE